MYIYVSQHVNNVNQQKKDDGSKSISHNMLKSCTIIMFCLLYKWDLSCLHDTGPTGPMGPMKVWRANAPCLTSLCLPTCPLALRENHQVSCESRKRRRFKMVEHLTSINVLQYIYIYIVCIYLYGYVYIYIYIYSHGTR